MCVFLHSHHVQIDSSCRASATICKCYNCLGSSMQERCTCVIYEIQNIDKEHPTNLENWIGYDTLFLTSSFILSVSLERSPNTMRILLKGICARGNNKIVITLFHVYDKCLFLMLELY
jgi:hypothetical protein